MKMFEIKQKNGKDYLYYKGNEYGLIVGSDDEGHYIDEEDNKVNNVIGEQFEDDMYNFGEELGISNLDYSFEYIVDYLRLARVMVDSAIEYANDNDSNFGDVYVGDDFDLEHIDTLIRLIEEDDRVYEVAGVTFDDTLDIIIKDKYLDEENECLKGDN